MLNKAARQLFARQPLHRVEDLEALGPSLPRRSSLPPGTRKITRLILDGVPQKAIFASAQVARLDKPVTVLSILPVQSELGALEVAAQADLVRVLTHEIMNSLTPVTSLARSGADLVAAAAEATTASGRSPRRNRNGRPPRRRHPSLRRELSRVRANARSPPPTFKAQPWGEEILQLALANAAERDDRRPASRSSRRRST